MRSAVIFILCLATAPGCVEDPASDESVDGDAAVRSDQGAAPDAMPGFDDAEVDAARAPVDAAAPDGGPDGEVSGPDGGVEPDQGAPETPAPTWVDCRVGALDGTLDEGTADRCDALHRQAPTDRVYGVRFVFLADVADTAEWIEARLEAANEIYEPAGLAFTAAAVVEVEDGTIEVSNSDETQTLEARVADLRAHLELADASIDELLADLRDRLLASGADPEAANGLEAGSSYSNRDFLLLMARAHPEDIYLVVADRITEREGVGGQASPPYHPLLTLERSYVAIRQGSGTNVPSHELGHYFGLRHPHARSRRANPHLFAGGAAMRDYRAAETHDLFEVLADHLGETLAGPVGSPFLPYDASAEEVADFEALRFALMDSWARWRLSWHDDLAPFETFADFVAAWRDGAQIGMSNYLERDDDGGQTNNCAWQQEEVTFACAYPGRDELIRGDDPLLDGYVLFDDGVHGNLMSYLREGRRGAPPRANGLFQEQIDVVRVSANTPQRLSLRNYAQE